MTKVLISGGTGLVGIHLCKKLQEHGFEVAILSRNKITTSDIPTYSWDLNSNEIDKEVINTCDYIIHLAGANIGDKRWTSKRKQEILNSRIKSGELIFKNIDPQNNKLLAFITASAVGYYGAVTSEKTFIESDLAANDFLGQTCRKWELMADNFNSIGVRSVIIRTGIVLSKNGGVLSKFASPIKLGIGSALGTGKQYFPWIHIDDLCNIYINAMENRHMIGAYNAVAPEHVTNKQFIKEVALSINKPFWFPNIPAFVIKLLFGKMSVMLLSGSKISSEKVEAAGYKFLFPNLHKALQQLNSS